MSTESTGDMLSSFRKSASAGGQLEHPSEVNNSTRTPGLVPLGVRVSGPEAFSKNADELTGVTASAVASDKRQVFFTFVVILRSARSYNKFGADNGRQYRWPSCDVAFYGEHVLARLPRMLRN
jgi:hypothetical protein